ncbi:serine hydrolase domain-containing protein [Flavobacterium psychrotrophum]|uniref:serine hydrolase domain-containing protein n=1 Tax=Flavobacterium psychrotrophum TaxID=2294119 RepID=UPI000E30D301|nr:serine hydrolase domain-containing protein [Flavobacterium psychrotrophum]
MKSLFYILVALLVLSPARAQQDFSAVTEWLNAHAEDMGGRVILVIHKNNKTIYSYSVSHMTRRQKAVTKIVARRQEQDADTGNYTTATRQPIASCSKWLSAALVMTFVDESTLKLTDTVGKFLPILSKSGKGGITISQCLSHTTGIKAPELKENIKQMKTYKNMDDAIAAIAQLPMEGKPGMVFHYSNTGLQIAGAVLEKISGKSFETLFAERIAQPLEMKDTDFGKGAVALPAGGAFSTPNDYLNFLGMILNKGLFNGRRILTEKSIAEMQVNRLTADVTIAHSPAQAKGLGYGYGEWVYGGAGGPSTAVSSPGLFGSYPWVDNYWHYGAFLMAVNLKSDGRQELYTELKELVDKAMGK